MTQQINSEKYYVVKVQNVHSAQITIIAEHDRESDAQYAARKKGEEYIQEWRKQGGRGFNYPLAMAFSGEQILGEARFQITWEGQEEEIPDLRALLNF